MQSLLIILILINLVLILSLIFGMVYVFKEATEPKLRAYYSVYLSVLLFLYLAGLIAAAIRYIFVAQYMQSPFLIMFFVFPFAIGNFASYRNLRLFTILQIAVFLISLFYIIYLYVNFRHI